MKTFLCIFAFLSLLSTAKSDASCIGLAYDPKGDFLGVAQNADSKESAIATAALNCAGNPNNPTEENAKAHIAACRQKTFGICNGYIAISIGAQAEPDGVHHLGIFNFGYQNQKGKNLQVTIDDAVRACQKFNPTSKSCVDQKIADQTRDTRHFFAAETDPK